MEFSDCPWGCCCTPPCVPRPARAGLALGVCGLGITWQTAAEYLLAGPECAYDAFVLHQSMRSRVYIHMVEDYRCVHSILCTCHVYTCHVPYGVDDR